MAACVLFMQAGSHSESVQDLALALAPFIWTLLFLPVLLWIVSVHPGFLSHSNKCKGAAGSSQSARPRSPFYTVE